tara:strand:+ start:14 stop:199 length:186 start_codon:yes stop_codon:yes gene_type:complete
MIGKMIPKLINKPEVKKLFKKTTNTKTKTKKYVFSSKSGVITSKGLLSKNMKISKKNLLGA